MDIAQLIDVTDPARAGRAQGTVADGDGGDDFAFARSYDLAPRGDVPADKPDPAALAAFAPADPALFGLMVALPITGETSQPLPDAQADLTPVAAAGVSPGNRTDVVLAQPVLADGWIGALMTPSGKAPGGPGDGAALPAPDDGGAQASQSSSRLDTSGIPAPTGPAGIVAAAPDDTRPDPSASSTTSPPDAATSAAVGRGGIETAPVAATSTAMASATATAVAANPAGAAASPAGQTPDTGSEPGQSAEGGPDDGPITAEDSREARPTAEDRPLAAPGRHGAAEDGAGSGGGGGGGGGDKGVGDWVAAVGPANGIDDLSMARPADLSVHGRGHPLIAQDIGRQLSDAMTGMPDRPVEIALSPEELGRVRMVITTTDGTVSLQVVAERPETVELMRRHADLLAQDLRQLGFDQLDLRFSGQSDGRAGEGPAGQPDQTATYKTRSDGVAFAPPDPVSDRSVSPAMAPGRSLDIRL